MGLFYLWVLTSSKNNVNIEQTTEVTMNAEKLEEIKNLVLSDYDPVADSLDESKANFYADDPAAAIDDIEWYSKTILELIAEIEKIKIAQN